jgi:hypothetical protein
MLLLKHVLPWPKLPLPETVEIPAILKVERQFMILLLLVPLIAMGLKIGGCEKRHGFRKLSGIFQTFKRQLPEMFQVGFS